MGQLTTLPTKGILHLMGKKEAASSIHFDLTNIINPIKWVSEPYRHIVGAFKDYNKNIWMGRRSLNEYGLGFSLIPGVEAYHYAIMIDGVVYQIDVTKKTSLRVDISSEKSMINSFQWYPVSGKNFRTKKELSDFAAHFEKSFIYKVIPTGDIDANCQTFVKDLFKYAAQIGNGKALFKTIFDLGTAFNKRK